MRKFVRDLAGPLDNPTKTRPQDRRGQHPHKGCGHHAGLLLQRYLCENATGEDGNPQEKRALLQAAISAAGNAEVRALYQAAFDRWSLSLSSDPAPFDLAGKGRLIVGLGSENALETGIRLHHTYGMPIIPGSALKGLSAHYCDQVWGERHSQTPSSEALHFRGARQLDKQHNKRAEPPGKYHRLLFGTTDEGGCMTFHDAWYVPGSSPTPLVLDVMTPHHPDWNDIRNPVAPTDFDSPTPVPFLSATGTFRLALSWHGPEHKEAKGWTDRAKELVRDAVKYWGIGGKTTSGYGRLAVPPPAPPPPPPKKRASGEKAKVRIIAPRPKGGFQVQDLEPGRTPGTLTVGTPPPGTDTNPGAVVDVLVHIDEPNRPQYKWPSLPRK
jgi:CRISPR-associated protein Cmr6